jgi:hypothetical protein
MGDPMHRFSAIALLVSMIFSSQAYSADLGFAKCKGSFHPNEASWRRQVLFNGQAFSLWNPNDRYEQNFYDMNEYSELPSGNIRGERRGSSGFNEFHYVVEASKTMIKLWEISIPHHNRKKITHFAECVLEKPMTQAKFDSLKGQVL